MKDSTPAAQLRLSEFIQAIEEAKKANPKLGELEFRYYSLPAKEAVYLMLTGQGDKASVEWRDSRPGDPRYCLKLFDKAGNPVPIDAESLEEDSNLYVSLEEVALHYLNATPNGYFCTAVPWRNTTGDFMLLRDETIGRCKRAFIPYLKARQILKARFPDVTDKEIALWLAHGNEGITAKASEYANARDIVFRNQLGIAEIGSFGQRVAPPTLADLLNSIYFAEEELKTATPRRWRSYEWLKKWAERYSVEEESLLAIIKPYIEAWDYRIYDPTPGSAIFGIDNQGEDPKKMARRMMYHADWILSIKESRFPDNGLQRGDVQNDEEEDSRLIALLKRFEEHLRGKADPSEIREYYANLIDKLLTDDESEWHVCPAQIVRESPGFYCCEDFEVNLQSDIKHYDPKSVQYTVASNVLADWMRFKGQHEDTGKAEPDGMGEIADSKPLENCAIESRGETARIGGIERKNKKASAAFIQAITELLDDIWRRASDKGKPFDKDKLPGVRRDLWELSVEYGVKHRIEAFSIKNSTFNDYIKGYCKCKHGGSSSTFYRDLYPELFPKTRED